MFYTGDGGKVFTNLDELLYNAHIRCNHLHVVERNEKWSTPPHKHDITEIGYVLEGRGSYNVDGVDYDAKAGDIFIIPSGTVHHETNTGNIFKLLFFSTIHLDMNVQILDKIVQKLKGRNCPQQGRRIYELIEDICDDMTFQLPGYVSSLDARIKLFYIMLLREKLAEESGGISVPNKHTMSERNLYVLSELKQYIQNHLDMKLNIEMLAQKFFYHPKYLSLMVKNDTGMTLSNYILSLRMQKARELLSETGMTIEEISAALGFSSMQHFFKRFKKEFNITPANYRKQLKA